MFIAIEGTDGTGKTEQTKLLVSRLRSNGIKTKTISFPRYRKPSSFFVKKYLRGDYGPWEKIDSYVAATFYSIDRFDASQEIRENLSKGFALIANRYTGSNMGHQAARFKNNKDRRAFIKWVAKSEYKYYKVPEPTLTILLDMPVRLSYKLIRNAKRDQHERNVKHLAAARDCFLLAASIFPKKFVTIECTRKGKLLSIQQIHEQIWNYVRTYNWSGNTR